MVSTKLVDGRATAASFGWRLYQVEVHRGRMAPFIGLDRLWRVFDRLDTVPHLRSFGTVAVMGDSVVIGLGGSSATAWAYDVRTKVLSRTPIPDWLNTAWVTPPPAFSTDGRYIAYLSQDSGISRVTVRSWPHGRVIMQSPPIQPVQRNGGDYRGGSIMWRNPEELFAQVPISDSGPSSAWLQARVQGDTIRVERWTITPDPEVLAERATATAAASPASEAADTSIQARFAQAAQEIHRLAPAAFPELPPAFRSELEQLGCTIPQSDYSGQRGNVIHGQFAAAGQTDWAVLCSRNGLSVIRVFWGGSARCPSELIQVPDAAYLQGLGQGRIGFSRAIARTDSYNDYPYADATPRRNRLEHDGIENAFEGKGSSILFCRGGSWITYGGND